MRGEVEKETPKKEMDNRRIFMTSHMTYCAVAYNENDVKYLHNEHLDRIDNFSDFYHSLVHMDHLVPVKCKKKFTARQI